MKTRQDVQDLMRDMRKSHEKAVRCVDQASRSSDPSTNAELMRTLHRAQDSLRAARRAIDQANGIALTLGEKLLGLMPEDTEGQAA